MKLRPTRDPAFPWKKTTDPQRSAAPSPLPDRAGTHQACSETPSSVAIRSSSPWGRPAATGDVASPGTPPGR